MAGNKNSGRRVEPKLSKEELDRFKEGMLAGQITLQALAETTGWTAQRIGNWLAEPPRCYPYMSDWETLQRTLCALLILRKEKIDTYLNALTTNPSEGANEHVTTEEENSTPA